MITKINTLEIELQPIINVFIWDCNNLKQSKKLQIMTINLKLIKYKQIQFIKKNLERKKSENWIKKNILGKNHMNSKGVLP